MQSTQRDSADLGQALARHLGKLNGLIGCQAILRHEGGGWREVARLGRIASDGLEAELAGFDPQAGGTVRPLEGGKGWRAGYACAGPSVELFVALTLGEMPAAELQTRLTQIEHRIGWLLVEAERSVARSAQDAVLSTRIGAELLIEAAEAASRAQLADQWIARLERALTPDLVAVCWVAGHAPKLAAISGGGLATQPSRQRSALEQLAETAVEARGALILDAGDGPEEALAVLDAGRAMALPVYDGDPCRAAVVLLWRDPAAVLPDAEAAGLVARVLGEALTIQGRAHPALLRRFGNWLSGLARAVFGRRALKLKLALLLLAAGLLAAALTPSQHRPAFDARIEARDRQVIAAPFDGFGVEANLTRQVSEAETGLDYRRGRKISFIQAPDLIYNASLTYQKYGLEARLSYQYQGAYIEDLRDNAVDKWVQPNKSLDCHSRYTFRPGLTMDFDVQNILDGHRYYTTKGESPSYQKDYMEPGRNFLVRLAYSY